MERNVLILCWNKRVFHLWLLVFLIVPTLPADAISAADPVLLVENTDSYSLGRHLDFLIDQRQELTIADIASPEYANNFATNRKKNLNFGFSRASYWLRFRLKNTTSATKTYILEAEFPLIDHVDLYSPIPQGAFTKRKGGELTPIKEREIQHRTPAFLITLKPLSEQAYYLRYQDKGSVPMQLRLLTPTLFLKNIKIQQILFGVYYGCLLVIILYNTLIFWSVKNKSYLYYVIFVSIYFFWQMVYNGLANEYLWPASPWLSHELMPFFIYASGISALQFSRSFLKTKTNVPTIHAGLSFLMICFVFAALVSLLPGFSYGIEIAAFLCVFFAPSAMLTGFVCWQKGIRSARYFSIAWFVLLCGTLLLGLKSFAILPSNFITEYGQQIGSILETALFSLALTEQLKIMRQEKEKAQAQTLLIQQIANQHLEEKVHQRTKELQTSNQQQQLLSAKLAKYLSPQVYSAIFSGKTDVKLHSYRKKLTVFFSDIKGFTELTDSMESESLTALLNDYLNEMAEIALRHGGTIDKYIGDAIMIFFGDPESRGDKEDALACVQMAIEMRTRMQELQKRWQAQMLPKPLRIRMGLNTGYCTVGNFGSEARLDYTIIGGQVNLASRLESNADPDQILVSYQTYVLVKDIIACKKKDAIMVKGIAYPVQTYEVDTQHDTEQQLFDILQAEGEGYSIILNFNRIQQTANGHISNLLERALTRLEPGSSEM